MNGYSPKLPLQRDSLDGIYLMNKTTIESIKQNFKNLLLTENGEKVMNSAFGVGLKKYLFEQNVAENIDSIIQKIYSQTQEYLPYIEVQDVKVINNPDNENLVSMQIIYIIPAINFVDDIII